MYAVARRNTFDPTQLAAAGGELAFVQTRHRSKLGLARQPHV